MKLLRPTFAKCNEIYQHAKDIQPDEIMAGELLKLSFY